MGKRITTPWGWWEVLAYGPQWKVKRLFIRKGLRTSLQSHRHRREILQVVHGQAYITDRMGMTRYQALDPALPILPMERHRIAASPTEDATLIEIQFGDCRESDIHRYEDDFGRAKHRG